MKFLIEQRTIAAAITVHAEDGTQYDCYYIAPGKSVQVGVSGTEQAAEARFLVLPMEVRAAVNRQFGEVFSLPIGRRDIWVKSQIPFTVEVEDNQ